jgi:hypothetical protein
MRGEETKPKIFKRGGKWVVEHGSFPRSFSLFGATEEERLAITNQCFFQIEVATWRAALEALAYQYRYNYVRRVLKCVTRVS